MAPWRGFASRGLRLASGRPPSLASARALSGDAAFRDLTSCDPPLDEGAARMIAAAAACATPALPLDVLQHAYWRRDARRRV